MSEQFKEEYWADAIQVLKREERKAWWRAYGFWLLLGLVAMSGAMILLWPQSESAHAHLEYGKSIDIESKSMMAETTAEDNTYEALSQGQSEEQGSGLIALQTAEQSEEQPQENGNAVSEDRSQVNNPSIAPTASNISTESSDQNEADSNVPQNQEPLIADESIVEESPDARLAAETQTVNEVTRTSSPANDMSNLAKADILHEGASTKLSLIPLKPRLTAATLVRPKLVRDYREYNSQTLIDYKDDRFFAFAGNSFLTGYGSYKRDLFFNPEVGVGYEEVLAEHWSANVSLAYFMINGVRHSADFTSTQLDFGFNSTVTTVSTLKLHYGYIPVKFNYDLNRRTSFSLGAGVSYLINSQSLITVKEVDNFDENEVDRRREWGYVGGYRTISGSLLAGYEFRLTENMTFDLDYQYGLQKITLENIYGQISEDRNSRLRVMLKYNIK
jgi:opacity protein-like surface antigen